MVKIEPVADRDYIGAAKRYRRDILDGRIPAGKWIKLACERSLFDEERARTKGFPFYFDEWEANNVCDFLEELPHLEGEWDTPNVTLEPHQCFKFTEAWGWRREENSFRRFTVVYNEVARKNGKSFEAAGVGLYTGLCEGENGPQIVTAGPTEKQARIVYKSMRKMIDRLPDLEEEFALHATDAEIKIGDNGGEIYWLTGKGDNKDGLNPHARIIDELHAHKSAALFNVLRSATGARKNPLGWYPTTAGSNTYGICYRTRTMGTKVLEGVLKAEHMLVLIYAIDEDDDPYDPKNWGKANPNLNVSVQVSDLREMAIEAKQDAEVDFEFKTKRTGKWLNAASAWIPAEKWAALTRPDLRIEDFIGQECWLGADLSDKSDITAIAALFYDRDSDLYTVFPKFYLPEKLVTDREEEMAEQYNAWFQDGYLILTDGNYIDHNRVQSDLLEWAGMTGANSITFDQYSGSLTLASNLMAEGYDAGIIAKNVANICPPAIDFEARVKAGLIQHNGHPILHWNVTSAVVTRKVDKSILPKKETPHSPHKIDGLDATLNAMARAIVALEEEESPYEDESYEAPVVVL